MALAPRLDLRTTQSLVMTPQLQQAIKLLALSNIELESFVTEEIEKNPLLEPGAGQDTIDAAPTPDDAPKGSDEVLGSDTGEAAAALDISVAADDFAGRAPSDSDTAPDPGSDRPLDGQAGMDGIRTAPASAGEGGGTDFTDRLVADITLHDHLAEQAGAVLAGADLMIARHLIDQIDECGYLQADLLELASRLGVALDRVERALEVVQGFDPVGVGARDLAECLALQAKEADRYDPAMARLIAHLDLLAKGALAQLKRVCRVDDEDLADMIAELRAYDPKPGCRIGSSDSQAVVPDIFVAERPVKEGKSGDAARWVIELNSATLPRVLVNRSYYAELTGGVQDKKARDWLNECLADASWLVKALDQRQRTIVKVAAEIVKQQEAFFRHGVTSLRPLTLRAVAEAIEMHESTVSRVTSNKYLSCARGTFELKYFFTSGIASSTGGEAASAEAVKSHIARLIADEDAGGILSDDKLVKLLKDAGFTIARRTVAKYREALGLGSSVQRRRQKAIQGKAA